MLQQHLCCPILCDNGETFSTIFYSNDEVNQVFVLNADGSYYDYLEGFEKKLDYSETAISCSAVYYEREYLDHKYSGNWAYNEDTNRITIVDFRYENFLDPTENQTYEDGLVYYGGNIITAVVVSGELILTLDYYDPFEDTTHIFTWIYKRR